MKIGIVATETEETAITVENQLMRRTRVWQPEEAPKGPGKTKHSSRDDAIAVKAPLRKYREVTFLDKIRMIGAVITTLQKDPGLHREVVAAMMITMTTTGLGGASVGRRQTVLIFLAKMQ